MLLNRNFLKEKWYYPHAGKISRFYYFSNCFWDSVLVKRQLCFSVQRKLTQNALLLSKKTLFIKWSNPYYRQSNNIIALPALPPPSPTPILSRAWDCSMGASLTKVGTRLLHNSPLYQPGRQFLLSEYDYKSLY
jgi:hypothetical protein